MLYTYSKEDKDLKVLLTEAMTFAEPMRQALTHLGDPLENPNPLAIAAANLLVFTMNYEKKPKGRHNNALVEMDASGILVEVYFGDYGAMIEIDEDVYIIHLYDETKRKKPTQWARDNGWNFSKS